MWVGKLRSRESQGLLEGTETALGGRDRILPFTEREACLGNGLGLSFMKAVLQRVWQSTVLDENHSWRREEWGDSTHRVWRY